MTISTILDKYATVEITETVPVSNRKTLEVYLNQELEKHVGDNLRDAGASKRNLGTAALKIIEEAGFIIMPPAVTRAHGVPTNL